MLAAATLYLLTISSALAGEPWAELGPPAPYSPAVPAPPSPISVNRSFELLSEPAGEAGLRGALLQAAERLGDWTLEIAGVSVDGPFLAELADTPADEPLLRAVRERFGRAIDLPDLLLFLDDVLVAGAAGRRGEAFFLPAGRLRSAGVLVHPDDVFREGRPRLWGRRPTLAVDQPRPQASLAPAADGDPLGPHWTTRFANPSGEGELLRALYDANPDFALRVCLLVGQLRAQGAEVYVTSTVRPRERGYLMWGAFVLSSAETEAQADATLEMLAERNASWGLDVPIRWRHPDGWEATVAAARAMADSYDVVYATERGARTSNHYGGSGADLVAIALPRSVTLVDRDGRTQTFDLSEAEQTRDLSLTPELIAWVESHLDMRKLRGDYPHWNDAAP